VSYKSLDPDQDFYPDPYIPKRVGSGSRSATLVNPDVPCAGAWVYRPEAGAGAVASASLLTPGVHPELLHTALMLPQGRLSPSPGSRSWSHRISEFVDSWSPPGAAAYRLDIGTAKGKLSPWPRGGSWSGRISEFSDSRSPPRAAAYPLDTATR